MVLAALVFGRYYCHQSHPLVPAPLFCWTYLTLKTKKAERWHICCHAAAAGSPVSQQNLLVKVGLGCRCVRQQLKPRQVLLHAVVASRPTWEQAAGRR